MPSHKGADDKADPWNILENDILEKWIYQICGFNLKCLISLDMIVKFSYQHTPCFAKVNYILKQFKSKIMIWDL